MRRSPSSQRRAKELPGGLDHTPLANITTETSKNKPMGDELKWLLKEESGCMIFSFYMQLV